MEISGVNATASQALQSLSQFAAGSAQEKNEVHENDQDADDAVKSNTQEIKNRSGNDKKVSGNEHEHKLSRADHVQQNKSVKENVKASQFFNQSGQIEQGRPDAKELDVFA